MSTEKKDINAQELMLHTQEVQCSSHCAPTKPPSKRKDLAGWLAYHRARLHAKKPPDQEIFAHLLPSRGLIDVPLTKGKVAIIDAIDWPKVRLFKWHAIRQSGIWYAVAGHDKKIRMHRLVCDAKPGQLIDHKDGDGLNNRRSNLRLATNAQNIRNSKPHVDKKTAPYKGVYFNRGTGKFRAQIMMLGKKINLGDFATPEAAAQEYDRNARKLYGDFARVNFSEAAC